MKYSSDNNDKTSSNLHAIKSIKNSTKKSYSNKKNLKHPNGWSKRHHYSFMSGQCGQSCPCCRAFLYNAQIDLDAKFGACKVCLNH